MKSNGPHGRLTMGSSQWELDPVEAELLLPAFRDYMYQHRVVPKREYYPALANDAERGDDPVEVNEFRADGQIIADRLDLMGLDEESTIEMLDKMFAELRSWKVRAPEAEEQAKIDFEDSLLSELDGRRWVELMQSSRRDLPEDALRASIIVVGYSTGSRRKDFYYECGPISEHSRIRNSFLT